MSNEITHLLETIVDRIRGEGGVVQSREQPDGGFTTAKESGQAFNNTTLLPAGSTFTSEWVDTDGWGAIQIDIATDQRSGEGGLEIQRTTDTSPDNPEVVTSRNFTLTQEDIEDGQFSLVVPTELDGFRVEYTNGPVGQNGFNITATLRKVFTPTGEALESGITGGAISTVNKSSIIAPDESGAWDNVGRSSDGLKVSLTEAIGEVSVSPASSFQTSQGVIPDSSSGGPVPVLTSPLEGRKNLFIENPQGESVFLGTSPSLTVDNGFEIPPGDEFEMPLDGSQDIWMVADEGTGSTSTLELDPDPAGTSGSATNPDNVTVSDDSRATFDAQGESIDASGFDASGAQSLDEVSGVSMGFEAQVTNGTNLQNVAHEETVTETQSGGTSITTPAIGGGENQCYVVFAANGTSSPTDNVDSVTGLGLTWTEQGDIIDGEDDVGMACYTATGSPSSDQVTVNYDGELDNGVVVVLRYSGVDQVSPVGGADSETQDNTNSITSDDVAGTSPEGVFVAGVTGENNPDLTSPSTSRADISFGSIEVQVSDEQADTSNSVSGVSDGPTSGDDWSLVAISLEPGTLEDPEATLEYEVGSEGVGATTLIETLTNTSDQEFTQSITGDRSWNYTDIDNTTLTLTLENANTEDLLVDHIFIEFTEVETGTTQRVSFLELA